MALGCWDWGRALGSALVRGLGWVLGLTRGLAWGSTSEQELVLNWDLASGHELVLRLGLVLEWVWG